MTKNNKNSIRFIALCAVLFYCIPPVILAGNVYTERRSAFFGGYMEFYNTSNELASDNTQTYDTRSYDFKFANGWFLRDNLAVGVKLGYGYSNTDDREDTGTGIFESKSHLFSIGVFMRNYFQLSRHVGFFVETCASAGFGTLNTDTTVANVTTSTNGNRFLMEAGFRPGMVFFIRNGLALEATVGFIGFTYSRDKTGEGASDLINTTTSLDFSMKVNQLRIQFGLAIYI
ncbi:MAG: autotransporter outer membrane beta-barrel domain-containing protein [bacterium]|nr:autotransporter outer membrane beta-barrel domain-containing protein [bacterium]